MNTLQTFDFIDGYFNREMYEMALLSLRVIVDVQWFNISGKMQILPLLLKRTEEVDVFSLGENCITFKIIVIDHIFLNMLTHNTIYKATNTFWDYLPL